MKTKARYIYQGLPKHVHKICDFYKTREYIRKM